MLVLIIPIISFLMPSNYKPIKAIKVAKAMVNAQHKVLEEAINSATDVRAEFFWGEDAISNHEAFAETAYFAKQQIMQDSAAAILAQANMNQGGLMQLVNT